MRVRLVVLCLLGLQVAAGSASGAAPGKLVNEHCPVMPDELAKAVHEITFRGVPVRFCCQQCKTRFLTNPQPYLANLPHVPAAAASSGASSKQGFFSRLLLSKAFVRVDAFAARWSGLLAVVLCILVIHWIAVRWQRKQPADPSRRGVIARSARLAARPSILLALFAGMGLLRLVEPLENHEALQIASGVAQQEQAVQFQAQLSRQGIMQGPEFVSRLEKTYYRGNDDRSSQLFNGGIYRTCEFNISLRTQDGKTVTPGQQLRDQPLFVRVEIQRSKNTLENHFKDADMTKCALIWRPEPLSAPRNIDDESIYPLKILEPGLRWAAEMPIGKPNPSGIQHLNGTVLICPPAAPGTAAADLLPSAHYAIAHLLRFEDGVLGSSSKLWMGAVVLPVDLPDEKFYEWLAVKPLPEVPDGFRPVSETEQASTQPGN
jgi:YHS domain-containing protein